MVNKFGFFKTLADVNQFKLRFINENNSIHVCKRFNFLNMIHAN